MRKPVLAGIATMAVAAVPFSLTVGAHAQDVTCPPGITPPSPYCVSGQGETPKEVLLRVQALLKTLLGKQANVNALQKNGVLNFTFTSKGAGKLVIKFTVQVRPNGTVVSAKNKTVVYATGTQSFTAAGSKKVTIKRTAAGKKIFAKARKQHRKVKITITSTFKPKTGAASTSHSTVKVK